MIVDRYSEEQFSLPVELKNAPLNEVLKFFPSKVNVTFSASLQDLKDISPEDFSLGVAYNRLNGNINKATIEVFNAPKKCSEYAMGAQNSRIFNSPIVCQILSELLGE